MLHVVQFRIYSYHHFSDYIKEMYDTLKTVIKAVYVEGLQECQQIRGWKVNK